MHPESRSAPPAAVDRNIFNMTEEDIQEEGIDVLSRIIF